MRARSTFVPAIALLALAACEPAIPESGPRGAGFDTPDQYAQRREAELRTGVRAPQTVRPPATPAAESAPAPAPVSEAQQLANETRQVLGAPTQAPQPPAPAPLPTAATTTTTLPAPAPLPSAAPVPAPAPTTTAAVDLSRDNPGLSQEQDFGVVSAQRTIEDDAARVNAARQQYQLVRPTELQRPNDNGPNIIAYALERAKPVGASGSYRRPALASNRRSEQRCQGYRTADVAQEEFLSAGGPERDRLNLDPDGDGNACGWDPATFRSLVRNQ
ncbi:hypothetical protein JANAI62_12100 [Jannaschia pagri]|uniref:Excalibur calcium-binding domain-containing protein n=1 Tax=Jannaschia pagri TaxID=2829797 RepID=A0ABQ4NKF7_9RHOB|nr:MULTISPECIES: hypothetical protein [unclassified Jannaschia]GIT90755.1 hypothetical protein JANAI61_12130 [Jannaschia sp. AI_61]GIT94587.1 hypothetical protein JANAI62_12100 [Jannaschia sp. AI_62]